MSNCHKTLISQAKLLIISLGRTFKNEQLKKIPQPAAIKGFVIQFFGCIENVRCSHFELYSIVTIETVNCPIKRVLAFMGPISLTEKSAAVRFIISQLSSPNTDASDVYGEHFCIIALEKCSIQFNLIEVVPLEGDKYHFVQGRRKPQ